MLETFVILGKFKARFVDHDLLNLQFSRLTKPTGLNKPTGLTRLTKSLDWPDWLNWLPRLATFWKIAEIGKI